MKNSEIGGHGTGVMVILSGAGVVAAASAPKYD
jgi:hypothetical protein